MRMAGSIAPGLQWGPLPPSDLRRLRLPSIGPERLVELVATLMAKSNYNEKHGGKAHFEYLAPVDSEIAKR